MDSTWSALVFQPANACAYAVVVIVVAVVTAAASAVYQTHAEVHVRVEDLGDEKHRRRNHGVLLPHRDLELVNPCWDGGIGCTFWHVSTGTPNLHTINEVAFAAAEGALVRSRFWYLRL